MNALAGVFLYSHGGNDDNNEMHTYYVSAAQPNAFLTFTSHPTTTLQGRFLMLREIAGLSIAPQPSRGQSQNLNSDLSVYESCSHACVMPMPTFKSGRKTQLNKQKACAVPASFNRKGEQDSLTGDLMRTPGHRPSFSFLHQVGDEAPASAFLAPWIWNPCCWPWDLRPPLGVLCSFCLVLHL